MSGMTAEQVWALVKDWPREAWPVKAMSYSHGSIVQNDSAEFRGGDYVHTPVAAHAFVGSGLAWLAEKMYSHKPSDDAEGTHVVVSIEPHATFLSTLSYDNAGQYIEKDNMGEAHSTLLEAVSAAVLAAAKEGA